MNKRFPQMIALFLLWLTLAACDAGPLLSSSSGSNVLFQDDFLLFCCFPREKN